MKTVTVWYMRPHFFADGLFGTKPDPAALEATHALLKTLEIADTADLDDVFVAMQGDIWSPNGEARELIASLGLSHTSMSIGDVVVDETGAVHLASRGGFEKIAPTAPAPRYALQTRLANGEWEHAEFCEGEPLFHATEESAREELASHLLGLEGAVEDGHMEDFDPAEWRVAPVA